MYGYDWAERAPYPSQGDSLPQIDAFLAGHPAVRSEWNSRAEEPYFTYTGQDQQQHYVAYEDADSTELALRLARSLRTPTVFTWYAGSEDAAVWKVLRTYSVRAPDPAAAQVAAVSAAGGGEIVSAGTPAREAKFRPARGREDD